MIQQSPTRSRGTYVCQLFQTMFDISEISVETIKLNFHLEQQDYTSSQLNNGLCLELLVWRAEVLPIVS